MKKDEDNVAIRRSSQSMAEAEVALDITAVGGLVDQNHSLVSA